MTRGSRSDAPTLGAYLELDRLKGRVVRLERVLLVLRGRARSYGAVGARVPPSLAAAIADFQRELSTARNGLSTRSVAGSARGGVSRFLDEAPARTREM